MSYFADIGSILTQTSPENVYDESFQKMSIMFKYQVWLNQSKGRYFLFEVSSILYIYTLYQKCSQKNN